MESIVVKFEQHSSGGLTISPTTKSMRATITPPVAEVCFAFELLTLWHEY